MEASSAVGQLDKIKQAQRTIRIINIICAGTGVGLFITFLIMNTQLILGNGMGLSFVPKLEGPELMIVLLLDFLMLILILVFTGALVSIISMFFNIGMGDRTVSGIQVEQSPLSQPILQSPEMGQFNRDSIGPKF